MKIIGKVTSAEDGDFLTVSLTTLIPEPPSFLSTNEQTIRIANTAGNRRAYYVGREVEITVRPR